MAPRRKIQALLESPGLTLAGGPEKQPAQAGQIHWVSPSSASVASRGHRWREGDGALSQMLSYLLGASPSGGGAEVRVSSGSSTQSALRKRQGLSLTWRVQPGVGRDFPGRGDLQTPNMSVRAEPWGRGLGHQPTNRPGSRPWCPLPHYPISVSPAPSGPPQNSAQGGAATHQLRRVWGPGPAALEGAPVPLRGSGLQGSLPGEQVGAGDSRAGVGDGHRHRDGGERARGLRSKRALHRREELPGNRR